MRLIGETELAACGIGPEAKVLVGLSGGADSVALLCALFELCAEGKLSKVYAAHLHHGIRAESADGDAAFCQALCERLSVGFSMERADAPAFAKAHGMTLEQAARTLRYDYLRREKTRLGADCIAVAHHAGDQAETVLLHLLRGSGTNGLSGMRMRSGDVVRPLLHREKREIEAYLLTRDQPWRTDETNFEPDATRNRVRHALLPALATFNPRVSEALCRLADAAAEDEEYLTLLAREAEAGARLPAGHDKRKLSALPGPVLKRVLLALLRESLGYDVRQSDVLRLLALLSAQNGTRIELRGGKAAWIENDALRLGRPPAAAVFETAFVPEGVTRFPGGHMTAMRVRAYARPSNRNSVCVNADAIPADAVVRTRRAGDRITPLGGPGSKLLSDYFIDRKIPRGGRDVPLLCCGGEVLWAVGGAVSETLRVSGATQRIMRICYEEVGQHELDEG